MGCILQSLVAKMEHRRKSVGEIKDARGSHDTRKPYKVRNSSSNDISDRPINGYDCDPEFLARLNPKWRCPEEIDENVIIED